MSIEDARRESGLPAIDVELLAAHACGRDRTWVIAHAQEALDPIIAERLHTYIERRLKAEPVAYITGTKEFFGRTFHVTPATLIPRPSTEHLVQIALDVLSGKSVEPIRTIDAAIVAWCHISEKMSDVKLVIDVGTGSGCIGITLASERADLRIIATDISTDAIAIARKNADSFNVSNRITFGHGSGLAAAEPINQPFLLVSNPPYIPDSIQLERDVADFEPSSALFAGKEGIDVLHPLVEEALRHPLCRGFVMECREEQVRDLPPTATLNAA